MTQQKVPVNACLYCGGAALRPVTNRSDGEGILVCDNCGLLMVEHVNRHTEKMYAKQYFDKPDHATAGYTNYLASPVANVMGKYAFARLFATKPGVHVDLGCADGSLMEIFATNGFVTHGLEISQIAANAAHAKGLDVTVSDLSRFPATLPLADVVTAFDLLEHVQDLATVLRETKKHLRPSGYFVFSTLSVKKHSPADYWFSHSLEHYLYFTKENLTHILSDTFGAQSVTVVETEVNGVAELWGIAKKGELTTEPSIMNQIKQSGFNKADGDNSYLLSLFYNQIAQFAASQKIIDYFKSYWPVPQWVRASFYNQYFQGRFQKAVALAAKHKPVMPAADALFWQALSDAEDHLHRASRAGAVESDNEVQNLNDEIKIYKTQIAALKKEAGRYTTQIRELNQDAVKHISQIAQLNKEVIDLRGQTFKLMDELQVIRNSRVVGRVIKLRDKVGWFVPRAKHFPKWALHKTRKSVAKVTPAFIRLPTMRVLRTARHNIKGRIEDYRQRATEVHVVANKPWQADRPLVSVVIPYYNRAATVDETVQSLQSQTFRNFELIFVNDGSTEPASLAKLVELKHDLPHATFIDQKNQGVAAARNTGVRKAKGKYIICLDSDDILYPNFIEKSILALETNPEAGLVTTYMDTFGVLNETYKHAAYDPLDLYRDNTVITAAVFRREAWQVTGGYKRGIGYEDWDFWLSLSEHGFWAKQIPEALFKYRVSMQSRYVDDKGVHWSNLNKIRALHPNYKRNVKRLLAKRQFVKWVVDPSAALVNLSNPRDYYRDENDNLNILITIPWMTFGGAETLIYNFCREINDIFNISFVTGLKSDHEWEHKFKEISPNIYHLANLFDDERLYIEFVSNYIKTRNIDVLHIIHNGFTFAMLPELKKRHPELKVVVTVFNDRVPYLGQAVEKEAYIDAFTADNEAVVDHFNRDLTEKTAAVIPNGINCYDEFSPALFDRSSQRQALKIKDDSLAVFFVGRLSEEKNPDVFLRVAKNLAAQRDIMFFVIGNGPMEPTIKKTIKTMGNVTYLGYQPSAEVARCLSGGDIFVLPSSIEGFPLSLLEAMAMQVAPVASDVGAVSDIMESGKEGFVVAPGSAKEITAAIRQLHKDQSLLHQIKKQARAKVKQKYSNVILGRNYKKLYERLIESKKEP